MKELPTLYKMDSKGKIREWRIEIEGPKYRTVSGLKDGKQVNSEWKYATAKNEGRSNATTPEEQAKAEVQALYTNRLERDYHKNIKDVGKSRFFKPMLADEWGHRKDKIEYPVWVQPKLDGVRCIASKDGLYSRQGKPILAAPHILEALTPLFEINPDLILDGELYNHDLKEDFNKIISLVRKTKPTKEDLEESAAKVEYHVYDVPSSSQWKDRAKVLQGFAQKYWQKGPVVGVCSVLAATEDEVDRVYESFVSQGYEGGIIRTNSSYEQKRSKGLLKRKDFQDEEFTIIKIEEGKGNWSSYAKSLIIALPDGSTQQSGLAGTQEYLRQVLEEKDDYVGGQATVHYFRKTPDGKLRFPVAKSLYKGVRDL
jgi:DNA ligase-1